MRHPVTAVRPIASLPRPGLALCHDRKLEHGLQQAGPCTVPTRVAAAAVARSVSVAALVVPAAIMSCQQRCWAARWRRRCRRWDWITYSLVSASAAATASCQQWGFRVQEGGDAAPGPPYALMDAPPLAVFANGLAAALNELRHCPPLVLQPPVTAVVQVS